MNDRPLLLSAFAFASGVGLYFVLPAEPIVSFPITICILSLACFFRLRSAAFLFILGFFYTVVRADLIDTNILRRHQRNSEISGRVESVEYGADKDRIFLRTPNDQLFRISVPDEMQCKVGGTATLKANLYAPEKPDAFNKFDYARYSFWNGTSGMGTGLHGRCVGGHDSVRDAVHFTAASKLSDALVLGYKNAISNSNMEIIRAAGIAHIFSISGFHIVLVGGWLMFLFSQILKLFPQVLRRCPSRNLAIPLTAIGLYLYLILSGTDTATVRAFLMACIGFLAIILGRRVLTQRNAAIVFLAMIVAQPFWLVSAGFQMSFAAVFGLLYFFSKYSFESAGKVRKFFYILVLSSIVATIWTAPFIVYHFGKFPLYGLIGNLVMLPLFSFAIMPLVLIGTVASAIGFRFPLDVADWIYGYVLDFCRWIDGLPFSKISVPDISPFALFLVFAAMFLFIRGTKKSSMVMLLVAIIYTVARPVPIMKTTYDGEVVGFMQKGNTYFNVNYSQNHPFIIPRDNKLRADCNKGICEYKTKNWSAISVQKFIPLYKNLDRLCNYDFVISYLPIMLPECQSKIVAGSVKIYESRRVEKVEISRKWHP